MFCFTRLSEKTEKKLKLAEIKHNLWVCYRDGDKQVKPTLKPSKRKIGEHVEQLSKNINISLIQCTEKVLTIATLATNAN